jgi:hypothetical protein
MLVLGRVTVFFLLLPFTLRKRSHCAVPVLERWWDKKAMAGFKRPEMALRLCAVPVAVASLWEMAWKLAA